MHKSLGDMHRGSSFREFAQASLPVKNLPAPACRRVTWGSNQGVSIGRNWQAKTGENLDRSTIQCTRSHSAEWGLSYSSVDASVNLAGHSQLHRRLRYAVKAAGLLAAMFAWFQCCRSRPGSLFASVLSAPAGQHGIKTAGGSAWAGLAAGCLHSLSGPDHLAALTPLTLGRTSVRASLLGAWWGFGHCIGQLILGLLMLLLKERFHNMVPVLDKYSSLTIGLTLLTIGVLGLYETLHEGHAEAEPTAEQPPLAFSGAAVAGAVPVEPTPASLLDVANESSKREKFKGFSLWTLSTGIIYGLQPDALFVVIPALALPTRIAAAAYMSMFVAGTVAAMGSYTAFIGATSSAMKSRGGWFKLERLSALASAIAVFMGIIIATGGSVSLPFLSHAH